MIAASFRSRLARSRQAGAKPRRGIALVFVLIFVIAMAALALTSIFMAGNSTLLAKSYDKERSLKYAAEVALAIGKSRVNSDPSTLVLPVDSNYRVLLFQKYLQGADSAALPGGVYVNVYVGPTGSMTGQQGRFSSIVAEARDGKGNGFIRRLELTQESFAKFAYWTNDETPNNTKIYFTGGDELWGPVFSNDTISLNGAAKFHDVVSTAKIISGKALGIFDKPPLENQKPITLPPVTTLSLLQGYAASGGFDFSGNSHTSPSNNEGTVKDRIEFVAYRVPQPLGPPDSVSDNAGFFRRFSAGSTADLRGDWPGYNDVTKVDLCGDWHYAADRGTAANPDTGLKFFPASVHNTTWFKNEMQAGLMKKYGQSSGTASTTATNHMNDNVYQIMTWVTEGKAARCYLAGDPHLVAVERNVNLPTANKYTTAQVQQGGFDSTFTPVGNNGSWQLYSTTPDSQVIRVRTEAGNATEAQYLFPLGRKYNNNAKGVIYESGNVGVSGTLNGLVTLYSKGSVVFVDDLRYANDPATARCHDILGLITDYDAVIADNALNDPQYIANNTLMNLDDTKDVYIHAVIMALNTSFRVQNYNSGPTNFNDCDGTNNGRGCIYLAGGLIQKARGAVGTGSGSGFLKRYSYDKCAVVTPPPYFPTTGRFQDNRFIELDPQGFSPDVYFQTLKPRP